MRAGDRRLGGVARREIERAWQSDELAVSAISFWEVGMLVDKGRIRLADDIEAWRRKHLEQGMVEIPVDGETAIRAVQLADFDRLDIEAPKDPSRKVGQVVGDDMLRAAADRRRQDVAVVGIRKFERCDQRLEAGDQSL